MSAREHFEPEPVVPLEVNAEDLATLKREAGQLVKIGSRLLALLSGRQNGKVTVEGLRRARGEIQTLHGVTDRLEERFNKVSTDVPELREVPLPKLPPALPDEDQG